MGRKRGNTGFDALAALPWPLGLAAGIAGFLVVRYGLAWWLSQHGGMLAQGIAQQSDSTLAPLAWIVLLVCWMAALFSFLSARHRSRLLDTRTTLESLAAGGWRQFELLVGEAFRRQGYSVEETGLGGADGGIDLILRKNGHRTLVQCKQWKRQQVGVSVVREMYGLLAHHQAHAVKIVCIGSYTKEAARFAQAKPIELIDGERLLEMIQAAQRGGAAGESLNSRIEPALVLSIDAAAQAPACKQCGGAVVERINKRTGESFLGCSHFPRCRGTG
ncbi:restriction endonuclease [Xanthomonas translucens]|uniref:restriction endonuclease n=1 Tax=Xanthomonas campestris pv. translucens TaxID=343 RepID=UPI001F02C8F9|nr:restriction endonuclease [Xanthomonas translucens]UKE50966.1 restriction endonuclease [Xanthomonas translucens]